MTNSEQAIREIAEKWGFSQYKTDEGFLIDIDRTKQCLSDLTALISEHYYPKEFVEWLGKISESDQESPVKWFLFVDKDTIECNDMKTDEAFAYWLKNVKR